MRGCLNVLTGPAAPDGVVFCGSAGAVTQAEFRGNIARCAAFFSRLPEKVLPLYTEDFPLFCTWFFALLAAGKEVVLPPHLRGGMLGPLSARHKVIVTDAVCDAFAGTLCPLPESLPKAEFAFEPLRGRFVSFFTSGSTAEPKLIRKTFESLAAETDFHLDAGAAAIARGEKPTVVASVSAHHMLGMLHRFLVPQTAGWRTDADIVRSVDDFIARQEAYEKICFITTPSFLEKIAAGREFCAFPRNCVRIVSSGAALKPETSETLREMFGVPVYEIFGSTEAGGVAWRQGGDPYWELFPCVEAQADDAGRLTVSSPFCGSEPFLMQDSTVPAGARRFALRGRLDRLVKVAEHRISLPELEARFEAHRFVENAYALVLPGGRTRLGALLTLSEAGKNFLKKSTKRAFVARLKEEVGAYFDPVAFPEKIRIVHEIPVNEQGKILRSAVLRFFENNLAEPVAENVHGNGDAAHVELTFVPDAIYFQGHFPDFPILPGVVQLHFACVFARRFFGAELLPTRVSKLKFAHMIFPGETVSLELKRTRSGAEFAYRKSGKLCSAGTLSTAENSVSPHV